MISVSLIINPIAAYALSRYQPPSAYKVLLFLMLTMAFPPMVTQIPVFLMLREFHLLNTFTAAYADFMFALLICQDEKMWTLMPWLYQLQQRSAQGVVFASLLIASIPTFILFVFCQKIIMRGIVVPVEK